MYFPEKWKSIKIIFPFHEKDIEFCYKIVNVYIQCFLNKICFKITKNNNT